MSGGSLKLPDLSSKIVVDTKGLQKGLKKASDMARDGSKKIDDSFKRLDKVGSRFKKIGSSMTKYITLPLVGLATLSGKTARDYESAFAGVRKTTEATAKEYKVLSDGIRQMAKEIPASAVEIANVAEVAGQLGIEKEHLLEFTRTMIDLGEATNMTSTEGAAQLARFANIIGTDKNKFRNLGSTIVELGNNFATTESDITSMGLRLAGAGKQIGLSESDVLGFATALSSVGVEAEAGGSAFSRVMARMQLAVETQSEELQNFATVAGMSGEQFKKAFQDDASGAINAFIKGLGESEKKGVSAIKVLEDMGITELRLRDALLRASGASELFTKAIELGSSAWKENNALTKEANERYSTSESQMKIQRNRLRDVGIEIGRKLLPHVIKLGEKVVKLVEGFNNLDEDTQKLILTLGGLAIVAGPALKIIGSLMKITSTLPAISKGIFGIGKTLGGVGLATAKGKALAGVLTAVGSVALPATAIAASLAVIGSAVNKHLTQRAVPELDLYKKKIEEVNQLHQEVTTHERSRKGSPSRGHERSRGRSSARENQVNNLSLVSDETKAEIDRFMELRKKVEASTIDMFIGLKESSRGNNKAIIEDVNKMVELSITAIDKKKTETLFKYNEIFTNATYLSAEEKKQIIESANDMAKGKSERVEALRDRLVKLYDEIRKKGVENSKEEQKEILEIYDELSRRTISNITENKNEQELILENLRASKDLINKGMVADAVKRLNENRDNSVKAAHETRDKSILAAKEWRDEIMQTYGSLTKEQQETYDKWVKGARDSSDKQVEAYEQLRKNGLIKLNEDFGKLTKEIDFNTGKLIANSKSAEANAKKWNSLQYKDVRRNIITNHQTRYSEIRYAPEHRGYTASSHYSGLDYVPYDGYYARLHRGERVLTAEENKGFNSKGNADINITISKFTQNTKEDIHDLLKRIGHEVRKERLIHDF